jgi:hypothetical protein
MAIKLNKIDFDHAKKLVQEGHFTWDERDACSEHQPLIREHGFPAFAKWRLEINSEKGENTKGRYEFPYGDFRNVHRCAVISAESRAGQYKHFDIERAAAHLHEMIDEKKEKKARKAHA